MEPYLTHYLEKGSLAACDKAAQDVNKYLTTLAQSIRGPQRVPHGGTGTKPATIGRVGTGVPHEVHAACVQGDVRRQGQDGKVLRGSQG
jgi:hypothetical protein